MPPKKDLSRGSRLNSTASAPKTPAVEKNDRNDRKEENNEQISENDSDDSEEEFCSDVEVSESEDEADEGETQGFSPCGKTKKQRFWCSGGAKPCGVRIVKGEDSVGCDACGRWFHPKCQKVSKEAFKAMNRFRRTILWLCRDCKPNLAAYIRDGSAINKRIDAIEKNVIQELDLKVEMRLKETEKKIIEVLNEAKPQKEVKKQIEAKIENMEKSVVDRIAEEQSKVEATLKTQEQVLKSMPQVTEEIKTSAETFRKMIKTQYDEGRKNNIILHNVKESTSSDPKARKEDDMSKFKEISAALIGEGEAIKVEQIFRLGKKGEGTEAKPRLLLVKLNNREHVDKLFKQRFHLKEEGYANTYLTKDLAPEERETQRKLREELARKGKESHRIFRGAVVPREEATN